MKDKIAVKKNLLGKYSVLPIQAKVSLWFTISSIIQNGISYITLPIFTRLLNPNDYGTVSVYNSWQSIMSIFITLNLSSGVFLTAYVKFKDDGEKLISSFCGLITVIATVLYGFYLCFADYVNNFTGLNNLLVSVIFIECVMLSSYNIWAMKLKFESKYKLLISLSLAVAVLNPALGIICIRMSGNGAMARILSGAFLQILLCSVIYYSNIRKGKYFYSKEYWKYALVFGLPLLPHYLSLVVFNRTDKIMIERLCGKSEAGIYSVGFNIACIINIVISGINTTFGPWFMQRIHNKEFSQIKKRSNDVLLLIFFGCVVLMLIEPEIIKIATVKEYYDAIYIMPFITAGIFFSYLNNLFARIEFYFEKKHYIAAFSIITAIVNIILNYIFIRKYGYYAASYTTLFSYILLAALHFISYRIIAKNNMDGRKVFDHKFIFILSIALLMVCGLVVLINDFILIRYLLCVIALIAVFVNRKQVINMLTRGEYE